MKLLRYFSLYGVVLPGLLVSSVSGVNAKQILNVKLDEAIEIVMGNSYRIKQLEMGIERYRYNLQSRQASLKSRVYMNLMAPEYKRVSEYKWNSTLKQDEIIRQNTSLWQMDLAVRQPVILLGYPTNGYLSLNNKMYEYIQQDGTRDINYYNRYYIRFEQPFFLPNELKNNIEQAELDLESRNLDYIQDRARLIESVSSQCYRLFEYTYLHTINTRQMDNLRQIASIAAELAVQDTMRNMDKIQAQLEMANVQEKLLKNQSSLRRQESESKQLLRMSVEDSIYVEPIINFIPINVGVQQALDHAFSLRPTLRMLDIDKRKNEIDLNSAKGWDAFNVNLEMTYGLEKDNTRYQAVWENFDDSFSTSLRAYVPIWDWGRRKTRIEAYKIGLEQTDLIIEENRTGIESEIRLSVENLMEYQQRTITLMESVKMAQTITEMSIEQYRNGAVSLQDIIRIINSQSETENNYLGAYQGYKRSLLTLMMRTFYDYENNISLIDKYRPAE